VRVAGRLNVPPVLARVTADPRYRAESHRLSPRKVGRHLALFDCLNCDKCLSTCPNDANFVYEVTPETTDTADYRIERGRPVPRKGRRFEVRTRHQIATFQDFCNDCGNCDVFCPEDGGPQREKPRFFGSIEAWKRLRDKDGFFVVREGERNEAWGRVGGREYHLEVDRRADRSRFRDGVITLTLRHRERRVVGAAAEPGAPPGHTLDFSAFLVLATVVDGVLDPVRANPVNALHPPGC